MTPSIRRLIIDTIRGTWAVYAGVAGAGILIEVLRTAARRDGVVLFTPSHFAGYGLVASWSLSFMSSMRLQRREVIGLPVTRRELWISKWWLSVAIAPLLIGVAERSLWLAQLNVLYCGCFVALGARMPIRVVDGTSARGMARGLAAFAIGFLLPFGLPFVIRPIIPVVPDAVGSIGLGVLIAATAVTIAGYFHVPANTPYPGRQNVQTRANAARRGWWPGDRLTGVSRLISVHGQEVFFTMPFAFGLLLFVDYTSVGTSAIDLRTIFHRTQLLPFDTLFSFDGPHGLNVAAFVFVSIGPRAREVLLRTRALRILPLSAHQLALTAAMLPLTSACIIWLWLLAIHEWLVGGVPATLRPDLFVFLLGGLALAQACELFLASVLGRIIGFAILAVFAVAAAGIYNVVPVVLSVAGMTAFAAGLFLMSWSFKNKSALYKFKPKTLFGMQSPQ